MPFENEKQAEGEKETKEEVERSSEDVMIDKPKISSEFEKCRKKMNTLNAQELCSDIETIISPSKWSPE